MELKAYPRVYVEKVSGKKVKVKGIDQYPEDTQTCCFFQLCCFSAVIRGKNVRNDCLTTIEGLDDDIVHENILDDLKEECRCKGKIVVDEKLGRMIQLEGDQECQVKEFLRRRGLTKS